MAAEYYDNNKEDLPYLAENSFLEDYDEDNLRVAFENAATVSIAYTLMKRCGLDTKSYFEHEDFSPIFDFNTSAAVSLLGTAVSEQSEQVFRQISLTIIKTDRERSNEHEQNHLQQERGLSDTRPHTDRAADTAHLLEIDQTANRRLEQIMTDLQKTQTPPDKMTQQMEWVGYMNNLKAQAEEMILAELVYS